jgi:hypothetical protein
MVFVKRSMNSKTPGLLRNARHSSDAFDFQFLAAAIRRRNQDLNANI